MFSEFSKFLWFDRVKVQEVGGNMWRVLQAATLRMPAQSQCNQAAQMLCDRLRCCKPRTVKKLICDAQFKAASGNASLASICYPLFVASHAAQPTFYSKAHHALDDLRWAGSFDGSGRTYESRPPRCRRRQRVLVRS
jgi:hypothetical protein